MSAKAAVPLSKAIRYLLRDTEAPLLHVVPPMLTIEQVVLDGASDDGLRGRNSLLHSAAPFPEGPERARWILFEPGEESSDVWELSFSGRRCSDLAPPCASSASRSGRRKASISYPQRTKMGT